MELQNFEIDSVDYGFLTNHLKIKIMFISSSNVKFKCYLSWEMGQLRITLTDFVIPIDNGKNMGDLCYVNCYPPFPNVEFIFKQDEENSWQNYYNVWWVQNLH